MTAVNCTIRTGLEGADPEVFQSVRCLQQVGLLPEIFSLVAFTKTVGGREGHLWTASACFK